MISAIVLIAALSAPAQAVRPNPGLGTSTTVNLGGDSSLCTGTFTGFYLETSGAASPNRAIGLCINGTKGGWLSVAPDLVSTNSQGNVILGYGSGAALDKTGATSALNNTFVGAESGVKVTSGQQNTFFGSRSGHELLTGNQNTGLGQGALFWNTASDNVAIGFHAGLQQTSGSNNVFVGTQSGEGHATASVGDSTGANLVGVGFQTLKAATTASQDVAIGDSAGAAITTATGSVLIGYQAGTTMTTGGSNTVVGSAAMNGAVGTSSIQNVAIGTNTMQATTLPQNVAVGYAACISCSSAQDNVTVGWEAGFGGTGVTANTTGDQNTYVGSSTGANSASAANRTALGFNAVATADNSVKLGNTSVTTLNVGNGHILHYVAPTSYTAGTCTSETGTGTEAWGTITATCTAQTWIVTFTTTYAAAPTCIVTPMNAAAVNASGGASGFTYTTSTTALTATVTTATTTGTWAFQCSE